MEITEAQQDLRRAYVDGGPGVIISSLVWLAAAVVGQVQGMHAGFVTLFLGGMLIFPLAKLTCRFLFGRANERADNPFGMTVLECTIAMIGGLFAAWLFLPFRPMAVMPLAAIAVGTHYFVFKTSYGDRTFWVLGAILTAIGVGQILMAPTHGGTAFLVAAAELLFGIALTVRATRAA